MTVKRLGKGERLPGGYHRLPKGKRHWQKDPTDDPYWYTHASPVKVTKKDGTVEEQPALTPGELYAILDVKPGKKKRHTPKRKT